LTPTHFKHVYVGGVGVNPLEQRGIEKGKRILAHPLLNNTSADGMQVFNSFEAC